MYKKYKLIFIILIITIPIIFNILIFNNNYKNYLINADLKLINEKIENKESFALLIGKDGCPACEKVYPKITTEILRKKENIYYYEINNTNRKTELKDLLTLFPQLKHVPYIIYIKDGVEVKSILLNDSKEILNELWDSFKLIKGGF